MQSEGLLMNSPKMLGRNDPVFERTECPVIGVWENK